MFTEVMIPDCERWGDLQRRRRSIFRVYRSMCDRLGERESDGESRSQQYSPEHRARNILQGLKS